MRLYEVFLIISQSASAEDVESFSEVVMNKVIGVGGGDFHSYYGGVCDLAYPIKKKARAHVMLVVFKLDSSSISGISNFIKGERSVLRSFVTCSKVAHVNVGRGVECNVS